MPYNIRFFKPEIKPCSFVAQLQGRDIFKRKKDVSDFKILDSAAVLTTCALAAHC
jgi:hypothetical protein